MARAKRTARADARRRYRAATDPDFDVETDDAEAPPSERGVNRRPPSGAGHENAPARVGIVDALRLSIHQPRIREDVALLPRQVTHPSFWLPLLVTIGATVAVIVTDAKDVITPLLFAYFVQTPAIGGVFLAGEPWRPPDTWPSWRSSRVRLGRRLQPARSKASRRRRSSCRRSWVRSLPRRQRGTGASCASRTRTGAGRRRRRSAATTVEVADRAARRRPALAADLAVPLGRLATDGTA